MDAEYWQQKWNKNELGFHEAQANALLVKHFDKLGIVKDSRVFLPLCGKTRDIAWLLANSIRVTGAELSELAIEQLFANLNMVPTIASVGELTHYHAKSIDVFVGDIFNLSDELLGSVDAVYDRAALVALPEDIRKRYVSHITAITNNASQLLITFEYDQTVMPGPPFSISTEELRRHYENKHKITLIESAKVAGGLKGICEAMENIWLLKTK